MITFRSNGFWGNTKKEVLSGQLVDSVTVVTVMTVIGNTLPPF